MCERLALGKGMGIEGRGREGGTKVKDILAVDEGNGDCGKTLAVGVID